MAWGKKEAEPDGREADATWDAPSADREASRPSEVTVVGASARLEGLLVSGGTLRIEGEVKGEVRAEGDVLIASNATVAAEIRAQSLRVEGRFTGDADVQGRVELGPSAVVQGNLTCASLVVADGAVFNGQTTMSAGAPVISLSSDAETAAETH